MNKTFIDYILKKKLIDPLALDSLRKEAKEKGIPLETYILENKAVKEEDFFRLKSEFLKVPYRSIAGESIKPEAFKLIPIEAVQHYEFTPIYIDKKRKILEAGMVSPENVEAREALKFIVHRNNLSSKIYLISPTDFKEALKQYTSLKGEVEKALTELEKELKKERITLRKEKKVERIERLAEEAPITKVVATILNHAIEERASDIHIEPTEKHLKVRFRVDGILHTSLLLPFKIHPAVISRIKVLSNLKIDETRIPQDGRFYTTVGKWKIDFRVSSFPTYAGEKIVMRILDPSVGLRRLSELGVGGKNLKILKKNIDSSFGLILITGPTGSGKTTTL